GVTARASAETGTSPIELCAARKPVGTVAGSTGVTWLARAAPEAVRTVAATSAAIHLDFIAFTPFDSPADHGRGRPPFARVAEASGGRPARPSPRGPPRPSAPGRVPSPRARVPPSARRAGATRS